MRYAAVSLVLCSLLACAKSRSAAERSNANPPAPSAGDSAPALIQAGTGGAPAVAGQNAPGAGATSTEDAGAPSGSTAGHDAAMPPSAGADAGTPRTPRPGPLIPEVQGECPLFESGTVTFAGLASIQLVVGSKQATASAPLLIYWHATGSTWAGERQSLLPQSVQQDIVARGGIIIAPDESTGTGEDCSGTAIFSQGDFAIMDQLVACAVRDHNVDPRRIYTTGCTAGGFQAGCMAIERASYIAAVLTNGGGLTMKRVLEDPARTPAVMTMYGATETVLIDLRQTSKALADAIEAGGGRVVECGHEGGVCNAPVELHEAGWKFLMDHPYAVEPEPYGGELPAGFPEYCTMR